jgi:hypothetical protein
MSRFRSRKQNAAMGIRCSGHATLCPQNFALTLPKSFGRSVSIVRSRTQATELFSVRRFVRRLYQLWMAEPSWWKLGRMWGRLSPWNCVRRKALASVSTCIPLSLLLSSSVETLSRQRIHFFFLFCDPPWRKRSLNLAVTELLSTPLHDLSCVSTPTTFAKCKISMRWKKCNPNILFPICTKYIQQIL